MRLISLLAILLAAVLAGGCDAFRTLAGRPTSSEIEVKRAAIARQEAVKDSLRLADMAQLQAAQKEQADSSASVDGLRKLPRLMAKSIGLAEKPAKRLYIMTGMYSSEANAKRASDTMASRGYPAELISYRSGKTAVGICGCNKIGELYESYRRFSDEPFCPDGVWILVNE